MAPPAGLKFLDLSLIDSESSWEKYGDFFNKVQFSWYCLIVSFGCEIITIDLLSGGSVSVSNVCVLEGGWNAWVKAGYTVEKK